MPKTNAVRCVLFPLLCWLAVASCGQRDPWAPCREGGASGFRAQPPSCRSNDCVQCVATLERAWEGRSDGRIQSQFRMNFMRSSTDARDVFIQRKHPDAALVLQHCTAGLAPGASCAGYSEGCVNALSDAIASGETSVDARRVDTLAAQQACTGPRGQILSRLTRCEGVSATDRCNTPACQACVAGYIAALTVSAPGAGRLSEGGEFRDLVERTPEPVARAVVEALGGENAPDDVEPQTAQKGVRAYCITLVRSASTAPPFNCNDILRRYLTQTGLADEDAALDALTAARADVRGPILAATLAATAREATTPTPLMQRLQTLPPEGTLGAVLDAMRSPVLSDGQYTALRALLVQRGLNPQELPPSVRAAPPTNAAPAVIPHGGAGTRAPGRAPVGAV